MDESTSKPAFNQAASTRVVNVRKNKFNKTRKAHKAKPTHHISLDPAKGHYSPVMTLDVEKYLHRFKDFVMTEEEKIEVLNHLWNIMCRFVELGFGMDSHSIACAKEQNKPRIKDGDLINLDNPEDT